MKGFKGDGVCILSFDSGGPGTYSQLLILQEIMARLANDEAKEETMDEIEAYPADYFDLIGGVGFGGLAALFLGHLRMNAEETIDAVIDVATAVFPRKLEEDIFPEENLAKLKEAVCVALEKRGLPRDLRLVDERYPPQKCKVALYAGTLVNINHPYIFRTYQSYEPSIDSTIVEAVCATMAVPSIFSAVKIGPDGFSQSFIGGALGANNPTRELFKEAVHAFQKDRKVAQIISLGSGCPRALSAQALMSSAGLERSLKYTSIDSENLAKDLGGRLLNVDAYARFNVDKGLEELHLDDWSDLGAIGSHTSTYIEGPKVAKSIDMSLKHLRERLGTITLQRLNQSGAIKFSARRPPSITPHYVLREEELGLMLQHLINSNSQEQKIFCITGPEGSGKTQLVASFLQGCQSQYIHSVFVDASSPSNIKADLQTWARSLGDGHEHDIWEDARNLLASGSHQGHWILVFDNADDTSANLVTFLPKCYSGTIVITSRNKTVGNMAKTYHLELNRMKPSEALATLLMAARRELPIPEPELADARKLMEKLNYNPAALTKAGTYCHQLSSTIQGEFQPYTFTQYLNLYFKEK